MKFIYIAILIAVLFALFLIIYGHIVDNMEIYIPGWVILFLSSVVTIILTQRMKSINKKPSTEPDVKLEGNKIISPDKEKENPEKKEKKPKRAIIRPFESDESDESDELDFLFNSA